MATGTLSLNKSSSTETVTVCCKLPHGLTLRIFNMHEEDEPVMGGGSRKVRVAREREERVVLNGWSHAQNKAPEHQITAGFALTHGVPKEFWDLWLGQNKSSMMVKNGLIFAHGKPQDAEAESKEKEKVRCGLERLDPSNLPRGVESFKKAS